MVIMWLFAVFVLQITKTMPNRSDMCPNDSIFLNQRCVPCSNFPHSIGIYSSQVSACLCEPNYLWSHSFKQCLSQNKKLQQNVDKSVRFVRSTEYNFLENSVIKSVKLQLPCSVQYGFIIKNNICLSCKLFSNSTGLAQTSSYCGCDQYFFWWNQYQVCICWSTNINGKLVKAFFQYEKCLLCSTIADTTKYQYCSSCSGGQFGQSKMGCHNCSTIPFSNGTTIKLSTAGDYKYSICSCKKGYRFSYNLGLCVCDIGYYQNGTVCLNCSTITNSTQAKSCSSCTHPFFYDNSSLVCRVGKNIINFNTTQFSCNNGFELKYDPISQVLLGCACSFKKGYLLNGSTCITCQSANSPDLVVNLCQTCQNTLGFHLGIAECINCSQIKYGTGEATIDQCVCQNTYFWNQTSVQCQCDFTKGYIDQTSGICFKCSQIQNTALPAFKQQCRCRKGYFWNKTKTICVCDVQSGLAFILNTKCIICAGMMGSIEKAKNNMCLCLANFVWDQSTFSCKCNIGTASIILFQDICINCLLVNNSNGFGNQFGCSCKNGFMWSIQNLSCQCGVNYFIKGQHCYPCSREFLSDNYSIISCQQCESWSGFAKVDNICYLCSFQINSKLATISNCLCQIYETWVPSLGACICLAYFQQFVDYSDGKLVCRQIPIPYNSCNSSLGLAIYKANEYAAMCQICSSVSFSNKKANGSECICISGYKWNTNQFPFSCTCSISKGHYINKSACSNCSLLSATQKPNKIGCLACDYTQGFLFDTLNDACIWCGSIPFTSGQATSKGCICKAGFTWNSENFTCNIAKQCEKGFIFNYKTNQCQCDFTVSIYSNENNCVRCDSFSNSNGIPINIRKCGCLSGYVWSSQYNFINSESRCICLNCPCTETSFPVHSQANLVNCFECKGINYTLGVNKNTGQCICRQGLVWNWNTLKLTGSCQCQNQLMIPIKNGSQCICNPIYSFINDLRCFDCRVIEHSLRQVNKSSTIPSCACKLNFIWNSSNKICQCLNPYTIDSINELCQCQYPLVDNGLGQCICSSKTSVRLPNGKCLSCSDITGSTGVTNPYNNLQCMCISNLVFRISQSFQAKCGCSQNMIFNYDYSSCICNLTNCLSPDCNFQKGFIKFDGHCISCKLFKLSNGSASNNQCLSSSQLVYINLKTKKLACKNNNYYNGKKCSSCQEFSNNTHKYNCKYKGNQFGSSQLGNINCSKIFLSVGGVYGACICQKGHYFNYITLLCQCDFYQGYYFNGSHCLDCKKESNDLLINNCLSCSPPFYFNNKICLLSRFIPNLNNSSPTLACLRGFEIKKNIITNQIISCACSAAQRYYLNGSNCSLCLSKFSGLSLQNCQGCNNIYGFHRGLIQCIYCPGIKQSTGQSTKEGCVCQNTYFWNAITSKCECDQSQGYFLLNEECFSCKDIPNTELPALNNACLCKKGYVWISITLTCDCDISGGYFLNRQQCITCSTISNTADPIKKNNQCKCQIGSFWNSDLKKCICDFTLNYAKYLQTCLNCQNVYRSTGIASMFGCVCRKGLIWSSQLGICHCSYGNYINGEKCLKCSDNFPDNSSNQDCQTCAREGGYNSYEELCYYCPSLGSNKWVVNIKTNYYTCACLNYTSQIWSPQLGRCICNTQQFYFPTYSSNGQLTCSFCKPSNCNSCSQTNNYFYHQLSKTCKSCSDITSLGTSYRISLQCGCGLGKMIQYKGYPFICSCNSLQGYYLSGTECLNCNNFKVNGISKINECKNCSKSFGLFLSVKRKQCIQCSKIKGSNGTATNSGCVCQAGTWNPISEQCLDLLCSSWQNYNPQTNRCECNILVSANNGLGCVICAFKQKTTGRIIANGQDRLSKCQCIKGYTYVANQLGQCLCEYPLLNKSGKCSCDVSTSFQIGQLQCFYCQNSGPFGTGLINQTNNKICGCLPGYQFKWNGYTKMGVCGCPIGYKFALNGVDCICNVFASLQINEKCYPCSFISYSNNRSSDQGVSCGCVSPFVWSFDYKNCTCNSSASFVNATGKGICLLCSDSIFAVSKLNETACNCLSDLEWNQNGYCECNSSSFMIITGKSYQCLICNKTINSIAKFNKTTCKCLPTLIWQTNKCECQSNAFSIIVEDIMKCVTCNASIFAKDKMAGKSICNCATSIFVWNATANSCVCKKLNWVSFRQGNSFYCLSCSSAINAIESISPTECKCINSNYTWSSQYGSCICADNSQALVNRSVCVACNSSVNANGRFNISVCICSIKDLLWQARGICDCNSNAVFIKDSLGQISCVTCNDSIRAVSKLNTTTCKCKTGFIWQNKVCICPPGTIYTYTTFLTCLNCKNSNNQTLDLLNCLCAAPKIWNNINNLCVTCGTSSVSKSTANTYGGIACGCVDGYIWDVMTNACILPCIGNNTICMNCKIIPNTNKTKAAIVGNTNNYRNINGGQEIKNSYLSAKTNYNSIANFTCTCSTGFSWDDLRKRCFSNLVPLN